MSRVERIVFNTLGACFILGAIALTLIVILR